MTTHPVDLETAQEILDRVGGFDWWDPAQHAGVPFKSRYNGHDVSYQVYKEPGTPFYLVEITLPPALAVSGETTPVLVTASPKSEHQPEEE